MIVLSTLLVSIKYKFNNVLGCDIGLVAEKAIEAVVRFNNFALGNSLKVNYILGMADYEDTPENLKIFNETPKSFYGKISRSSEKLKEKLNALGLGKRVRIVMITRFFGSGTWGKTFNSSAKQIEEIFLGDKDFRKILAKRKKLYLKMGSNYNSKELISKIIDHAREYYVVGKLVAENIPNVLILGLNNINMEFFYRLNSDTPVVYLSKTYE